MPGKTNEGERHETINELSDLLSIAQEMAQRLAKETHGDLYPNVNELMNLLHQAHIQLEKIKNSTVDGG